MRLLVCLALAAGLFGGVLFLGGSALGVWDEVPAGPRTAAEPQTTSAGALIGAQPENPSPAARKPARKKEAAAPQNRRAPREHLVAADMAIARKAVLRPSDMQPVWERVRLSTDAGPGCLQNNPDLSRFTVTGKARSAFEGGQSRIESRVRLFANAGQAALYFEATSNRTILRCIRDGVKEALRKAGLQPRVMYARFQKEPPIGSQTAHYVIGYELTLQDGTRQSYPVDMLTFQVGRAVGALSFNFVPSEDGSRPCPCELEHARLVASRLYRT
jgi:hypothetical protein